MSYPDFVCMGFQKCGTSTLHDILNQHPQIVLCRDVKEPMYYRIPVFHLMGKRYYDWRYFGHVGADDTRLSGEINAGLTYTHCARNLARNFDADTKMIFMLRDPVSRSYSAYKYFLCRGFLEKQAFKDDAAYGHAEGFDRYVHRLLENPKARRKIMQARLKYLVLSQSNYGQCIEEYLTVPAPKKSSRHVSEGGKRSADKKAAFDRKNMKFVVFEEFIRDEHQGCREIYDFLGVEDAPEIAYDIRANEGKEKPLSSLAAWWFMVMKGANYFLYDICAITHWGPGIYKWFRKHLYEKARKRAMTEDDDRSRVLPETRKYLQHYFEEDVKKAEKLTGLALREIWGW